MIAEDIRTMGSLCENGTKNDVFLKTVHRLMVPRGAIVTSVLFYLGFMGP